MNENMSTASADKLSRLHQLLQADPTNGSLRRQCVDLATQTGQYAIVVQLADSVLAASPSDSAALFDKATGLIGQRNYRPALEVLQRLPSVAATDNAVRSNLALCCYCLGDFSAAKEHLDACRAAGAMTSGMLRMLVSSCHHLGLLDEAVSIAGENQALASSDAGLAGVFALLYLDADDPLRAGKFARLALQLNPKSLDGRVTEATLLTTRLETTRAQQMLESVVADAPSTARAWIGLGTLSLLAQQLDTAKQQLSRGLDLMPDFAGAWQLLGWAQLASGDLTAATATFQQALAVDSEFAETYGGLATVAAMRGEQLRAQELIDRALQLDPDCFAASVAQAALLGRSGQPHQAQDVLSGAVAGLADKHSNALSRLLLRPPARRH
jgi:tetratricopeptide (TPR) repeat protein